MDNTTEQLGEIVWRFIDQMNDYDTPEQADVILQRFIKACEPIVSQAIDDQWQKMYGYTYTEFMEKRTK